MRSTPHLPTMTMRIVPAGFRCVINEHHKGEDALLFWQWLSERYPHLKQKFKDPNTEEKDINDHVTTMVKEYRNQKGKFSAGGDDGYTTIARKGANKGGKGDNKGKGKGSISNAGAQASRTDDWRGGKNN